MGESAGLGCDCVLQELRSCLRAGSRDFGTHRDKGVFTEEILHTFERTDGLARCFQVVRFDSNSFRVSVVSLVSGWLIFFGCWIHRCFSVHFCCCLDKGSFSSFIHFGLNVSVISPLRMGGGGGSV